MIRGNWIARMVCATSAAWVVAGSATAGLLPVSVAITPDSGNFRWTYAIVLPTDMKLEAGNYFTIYDFAGYVAGSESAPEGWEFGPASKVGPTPDRLNPGDDPELFNLTWKYTGPTIPSGQIGLGNFWAISSLGNQADSFFTAITKRTSDGLADSNITDTIVPVSVNSPEEPPSVPEPATLALAVLGLPVIGLKRLRRRKA